METLNESLPHGTGSGSGPRRQDTILRDIPAQTRFERLSKQSNDLPLLRVNTLGSGEDNIKLNELMEICTKLSERVLALENFKMAQDLEITNLKKRVKKLEKKTKLRTSQLKRRSFKVRIKSSVEKKDVETHGRYGHDIEINTASTSITTASINITTAEPVTTATMMEADYDLAQRIQAEEQRELTIKERSKLFVKLMDKRKKHVAKLRAEEIRRKLPTKAQKRNQLCTYLKNMDNYKHSQSKNKSFEEIQMLFDNTMKWVDSCVPMDSEVVKGSKSQAEGSKKRTRKELDEESVEETKARG
ncbi:hypothetical protein Tco_0840298 [Tanacetum coccineum]|uniref:Uncharacterized protein n=1 Tax=Tanacetum coccineum TaxID=301880 RepID=A0ABQ5AXK5_9ASTR